MREREREEERKWEDRESAHERERERERERCCEQVEGGGRNDVEGERCDLWEENLRKVLNGSERERADGARSAITQRTPVPYLLAHSALHDVSVPPEEMYFAQPHL